MTSFLFQGSAEWQVGIPLTAPPLGHAGLPSLLKTTARSHVVLSAAGDVWVNDLGGKHSFQEHVESRLMLLLLYFDHNQEGKPSGTKR